MYDMPSKIEDVIRKFKYKYWLTSTDVTSGHFNVKLAEESRKYTISRLMVFNIDIRFFRLE